MGVDALVKRVLKDVGIREERYTLQWASAAEAPRFVQLITRFTEQIRELGPIGQAEGLSKEELTARINKALAAVSDQKVRIAFGSATKAVRKDGIWTNEHIGAIVNEKMEKSLATALG
jgi:hypothetical protein